MNLQFRSFLRLAAVAGCCAPVFAQTVFQADFEASESYTLGSLDSQNGWAVNQGTASVTDATAFSLARSVALSAATPGTRVSRSFNQFASESIVFVDFYARPTAAPTAASSTLFSTEVLRTGFVTSESNGEVYVLDGDGLGGGTWLATGRLIPIDANAQAQAWTRFTFRHDFNARRSDLYINGAMVKAGLHFGDDSKTALVLFEIQAPAAAPVAFDYFFASPVNPLFVDADKDGIEDAWETKHLGVTTFGAYDDPGGVGRSLAQSYAQGLSPWPAPVVSSGLQAWFRADRGVTKDGSNKVSQWVDLSGNGVHVTQATGAAQPLAVTLPIAARPAVQFGGAARLRSSSADLLHGSSDMTIVAVVRPGSSQNTWADIVDYDHTTAPYGGFVLQQNENALNQYALGWRDSGNSSWIGLSATAALAAGNTQVLAITKSGTTQTGHVNGEQKFSASVPAQMLANTPRILSVGAWGATSADRYFNGDVAEILIYNRALSASERQQVEAALLARYFDDDDSLPGAWELKYLGTLDYGPGDDPGGVGRTLSQSYSQSLSPWPAATVSSGLQAWFRADLGVAKDGVNKINRWTDVSGNGVHIEQATTSAQPLAVASGWAGMPVVRFDGSATRLRSGTAMDLVQGSTDVTVFAVVKPGTSQATYADILDYNHTTAPYGGFVLQQNQDSLNQYGFGWWYNGGWQGLTPTASLASSAAQLLGMVKSGTTQTGYVNAEQKFTTSVPAEMQVSPPRIFGAGAAASTSGWRYFNGDVAEVLIYNRALSTSERQQVEAALISKYTLIAPSDLAGAALSPGQTALTWNAPLAAAQSYTIERQAAGGSFSVIGETTRRAWIDGGLTAGTQYGYRVRAQFSWGASGYSNVATITMPGSGYVSALSLDGVRLWLRGDAGVTASPVAAWRDQSGDGKDALQSNTGNQPQLVAAQVNGLPVVRFDGTDDFMTLPQGLMSGATSGEALVVLRSAVATHEAGHGLWMMGGYTDSGGGGGSRYPYSSGTLADDFGSSSGHGGGQPPSSVTQYHLYNVSSKAGEWIARFNSSVLIRDTTNVVSFNATPLLGSGYRENNGTPYYFFYGDVAEALVFDRVLSHAERNAAAGYLNAKYALHIAPLDLLATDPEGDADGDTLSNRQELDVLGTDPTRSDTDGDGVRDDVELQIGTNPLVSDLGADTDADGVTNAEEYALGSSSTTPATPDTAGTLKLRVYRPNP